MSWTRVRLDAFGGPEQLALETVADLPEPAPGEARVRIRVTSAAFTDVMIREGQYPDVKERPPFTPGYDMVGIVDALGPGVGGVALGDRVADLTTIGAYGDYLCLPADRLTRVPDGVSDADALAMILSAVTPWQMLHRVARMRKGQSLLIHGAGGAVGTAMLQIARAAGIIAYGSDVAAKHDLIRRFGGRPVAADAGDLAAATEGGVDVVFDPLGADSLSRSLHALKPGGMLVAFGFMSAVLGRGGSIPWDFVRLTLWDWLPNGHATAFYSIGTMRRKYPDWFREDLAALFAMLADGRFEPAIAEVLPLSDVRRGARDDRGGRGRRQAGPAGFRSVKGACIAAAAAAVALAGLAASAASEETALLTRAATMVDIGTGAVVRGEFGAHPRRPHHVRRAAFRVGCWSRTIW